MDLKELDDWLKDRIQKEKTEALAARDADDGWQHWGAADVLEEVRDFIHERIRNT